MINEALFYNMTRGMSIEEAHKVVNGLFKSVAADMSNVYNITAREAARYIIDNAKWYSNCILVKYGDSEYKILSNGKVKVEYLTREEICSREERWLTPEGKEKIL